MHEVSLERSLENVVLYEAVLKVDTIKAGYALHNYKRAMQVPTKQSMRDVVLQAVERSSLVG